jgi:tetratricopeptide (TPR) repeat protein
MKIPQSLRLCLESILNNLAASAIWAGATPATAAVGVGATVAAGWPMFTLASGFVVAALGFRWTIEKSDEEKEESLRKAIQRVAATVDADRDKLAGQLRALGIELELDAREVINRFNAIANTIEEIRNGQKGLVERLDVQEGLFISLERFMIANFGEITKKIVLQNTALEEWKSDLTIRDAALQRSLDSAHDKLDNMAAMLREVLAPKQVDKHPFDRPLSAELIEKARMLLERGDAEQQALAKIALGKHEEADTLIQSLKRDPIAQAHSVLTLEGDNWFASGAFELAVGSYEKAFVLRPDVGTAIRTALAHLRSERSDIAIHKARAIHLLELAAETLHSVDSLDFAKVLVNLASAWLGLPNGARSDNVARAMAYLNTAQTVLTKEAFPLQWAEIQTMIGTAWRSLPTGAQAENMRAAIGSFESAATVLTKDGAPLQWAALQSDIGKAWKDMTDGDPAANIAKAIGLHETALTILTEDNDPIEFAETNIALADALVRLPIGNRVANLRRAIPLYRRAVDILLQRKHRRRVAELQVNLGLALDELADAAYAPLRIDALEAYEEALTLFTRDEYPRDWALTVSNMARKWLFTRGPERDDDLAKAIAAYEDVAKVLTKNAEPVSWAVCMNNLGIAWLHRQTGDRRQNLLDAMAYFERALEIRTRAELPADWGTSVYNLAGALADLAELPGEDRCQRLREALAAIKGALAVRSVSVFPGRYKDTFNRYAKLVWRYNDSGCAASIPSEQILPRP